MSLYKLGGGYFVQDGHHRVSLARFHGAEWIDAEVTELSSPEVKEASAPVGERPVEGVTALAL